MVHKHILFDFALFAINALIVSFRFERYGWHAVQGITISMESSYMWCIVCWGFHVPLKNFSLIWRRHHSEGLQILTYTRHSRPLISEGSLVWHTYSDTGFPFVIVFSEEPWHSHLLLSIH